MKRGWLAALLLLSSCQQHSQWHATNLPVKNAKCTRLTYKSEDPIQGIDIEFLQTSEGLSAYLHVHTSPITKEWAHITNGESQYYFKGEIHDGGQKFQIPNHSLEELIGIIKAGKPVIINLEGYQETLEPTNIEKALKHLENPPYKLPINLPF